MKKSTGNTIIVNLNKTFRKIVVKNLDNRTFLGSVFKVCKRRKSSGYTYRCKISVDDFKIFKTKKRIIKFVPNDKIWTGTLGKRVVEALYRIKR